MTKIMIRTFTNDFSESIVSNDLDLGGREFLAEFIIGIRELCSAILRRRRGVFVALKGGHYPFTVKKDSKGEAQALWPK